MALVTPGVDPRDVAHVDEPESDVITYSSTIVIVAVLVGIVALVLVLWFVA